MKKIIALFLVVFISFSLFGCNWNPELGDLAIVVKEQDAENTKWKFGNGEQCYEIGINKKGMPIFVDSDAAFNQFVKDYADAIKAIKKQFRLRKISKSHWMGYNNLGCQLVTDDEELQKRADQVSLFLGYYKNSFNITSPEDFE